MTEEEARHDILRRYGGEVSGKIAAFLDLVAEENTRQNLVSASTLPHLWSRHALDSLQLLHLAEERAGLWIDIGSGGGFPGLVVGIARSQPVLLVEPRRKRAEFLERAVAALGLGDRVTVAQQKMERVSQSAAILSARAVAGIEAIFDMAHHCAGLDTRWLLPRGRITPEEVSSLRRHWRFMFHVKQSHVDEASSIAVFDQVVRR